MFVILCYDFSTKRVGKALKICRKYLTWVQNSVFEGQLTEGSFKKLKKELERLMDIDEDSLIIYTVGNLKYSKKEIIGIEKTGNTVFL